MTNFANIANIQDHERFQAADAPPRPKGAQVEHGYTRVANEILEAAMRSPMTSREARIFQAVVRSTFGWQRSSARLSQQALAKMTGLPAKRCSEALNSLLRKRVLMREGGGRSPIRINTRVEDWNFEAQQARMTPKQHAASKRCHYPQDEGTERPQSRDTYKERKEINTSPIGEESTAGADDVNQVDQAHPAEPQPDQGDTPAAKTPSLPNCPHHEILDLWAEMMPDKRQPNRSLWPGSAKARHLAARWKAGFTILNEQTGEPLYRDTTSGLEWWGRFFRFLRKSEFLMRDDSRWFGLDWVANKENFRKILELAYHGGES